jgi:hypothetical protein
MVARITEVAAERRKTSFRRETGRLRAEAVQPGDARAFSARSATALPCSHPGTADGRTNRDGAVVGGKWSGQRLSAQRSFVVLGTPAQAQKAVQAGEYSHVLIALGAFQRGHMDGHELCQLARLAERDLAFGDRL